MDNQEQGLSYCLRVQEDLEKKIHQFVSSHNGGNQFSANFIRKLTETSEIPITFSQEIAYERKLIEFITPKHPLATMALEYWSDTAAQEITKSRFKISTENFPTGLYHFFLFSIEANSLKPETRLQPIIMTHDTMEVNEELSEKFLGLIQTEKIEKTNAGPKFHEEDLEAYKDKAEQVISQMRRKHETEILKTNDQMIEARKFSIQQSYEVKKLQVEKRLKKATNPSIMRMYKGQLRNMAAKADQQLSELDAGKTVFVRYQFIMDGIFEIK